MNIRPSWFPKKKLKYQFTCFISLGDQDEDVNCDDCEDCESPIHLKFEG